MRKFIGACLLLFVLISLNTKVFAATMKCEFKHPESRVEGIDSLQLSDEALVINEVAVIELSQTRIKCGHFGKQRRLDGVGNGLQVILKSCTDAAALEGHLIDSVKAKAVEVICYEI